VANWRESEMLRAVVEIIGIALTLAGYFWALWTYRQSLMLQRAKWVKDLYDKFYEHSELKKVRDLLDSDDHQQIRSIVAEEGPAFTDYLNFFEFLGYLLESKQIKAEEIRGLFDYYLRNLKRNEAVAAYIADPTKGFEKLQKLLTMVEEVGCK
jgi:hypothetical protein